VSAASRRMNLERLYFSPFLEQKCASRCYLGHIVYMGQGVCGFLLVSLCWIRNGFLPLDHQWTASGASTSLDVIVR
jgi:hypothetical protein